MNMSGSVLSISDDDENENSIKGFGVSLTWDYPDNHSLQDVINTIFHTVDHRHMPRSESQFISNCVQASGAGIVLSQPNPDLETISCELQLSQISNKFRITKLLVVSEAKHIELFLNHIYAKTSKGCMISAKKGKKLALYENEFDLSNQTSGIKNVKVKFASLGENFSMRLQMIMLWVMPVSKLEKQMAANTVNLSNIQDMVESIGMFVNEMEDGKEFDEMSYAERQSHISDKKEHIEAIQNLMHITGVKNNSSNHNLPDENENFQPRYHPPSALSFAIAHSKPGEMMADDGDETAAMLGGNFKRSDSRRDSRKYTDDGFDGYGTPNPPNESVLANAILNKEAAKYIAESKASAIEEQNYQQAQMELQNNFNNNIDHHNNSTRKGFTPEKPPRKLAPTKRRPHSFAAPSPNEQDFTNLLSNLMKEESDQTLDDCGSDDDQLSSKDVRWQAYLKSRIRASQKMSGRKPRPISSISLPAPNPQGNYTINRFDTHRASTSSYQNQPLDDANLSRSSSFNYGSTKSFPIRRSEENCSGCQSLLTSINMSIKASEERIKSYVDQQLNDLQMYFDDRLQHQHHRHEQPYNNGFHQQNGYVPDHMISRPRYYHVPRQHRDSKSSIV